MKTRKPETINEIIIHCSDTEGSIPVSYDDFYKWHVKERGYKAVGYHIVIQPDGTFFNGRELRYVGAHCKCHNLHSIGICYVGGRYNGRYCDTRTPAQKTSLIRIISSLCDMFPITKISGHRDYSRRSCPCFDVSKEYSHLIKTLL